MTRRVFVNVQRGITDSTAVCVFPWETNILMHIHRGAVQEVTIDQQCEKHKEVVKVEKVKIKHSQHLAPTLREQLEVMEYVAPDDDPANDPQAEYNRLADKYGMDKDVPLPVVTRIYGEFLPGCPFEKMVLSHAKDRAPKPRLIKLQEAGLGADPRQMSVAELRDVLDEKEIAWAPHMRQKDLAALLEKDIAQEAAA